MISYTQRQQPQQQVGISRGSMYRMLLAEHACFGPQWQRKTLSPQTRTPDLNLNT